MNRKQTHRKERAVLKKNEGPKKERKATKWETQMMKGNTHTHTNTVRSDSHQGLQTHDGTETCLFQERSTNKTIYNVVI